MTISGTIISYRVGTAGEYDLTIRQDSGERCTASGFMTYPEDKIKILAEGDYEKPEGKKKPVFRFTSYKLIVVGTIEKIIYASPQSGFAVLVVRTEAGRTLTVAGKIYEPKEEMQIFAEGEFVAHPKYGHQFSVTSCKLSILQTKDSAYRYLCSGCFTGVGKVFAKRIVDHFGATVIEEIIEKAPERLTEVHGISKVKAESIAKCHAANFVYQELAGMGLTPSQVHKLYTAYGAEAGNILKEDPYKPIYDIDGFGFATVDTIARKNGIAEDDPKRVAAAITFVLTDIGNQGHCWCHIDNLQGLIQNVIPTVPMDLVTDQLVEEFKKKTIIREGDRIYASSLYNAEANTAKYIADMVFTTQKLAAKGEMPVTVKQIEKAIFDVELDYGFELGAYQRQAVVTALTNCLSIITGGPGTGKTTIITAVIRGWMKQYKPNEDPEDHVLLCAPTGKAARRMTEVTGIHAETIQRIMARQKKDGDGGKDRKIIILDEASMLDIKLAYELLWFAVQKGYFLVLVGDVDQLPPIGPGAFFRDLVQSPFVPSTKLELSHRQKGTIAINAKKINDGLGVHAWNLEDPESFRFTAADKETVQEVVVEKYLDFLRRGYKLSDICCIVPIRKAGRSQTAAEDLNRIIRDRINPDRTGLSKNNPNGLRVGDRVMNTENDYDNEVFNGDCGIISAIDPEEKTIVVHMDDGRYVEFNVHRSMFLTLAYAMSTHKAQGSEYKCIVIACNMEHFYMLQRNLLYTAATRARVECDIVGEAEAIAIAVSRIPALERNTSLRERITKSMVR